MLEPRLCSLGLTATSQSLANPTFPIQCSRFRVGAIPTSDFTTRHTNDGAFSTNLKWIQQAARAMRASYRTRGANNLSPNAVREFTNKWYLGARSRRALHFGADELDQASYRPVLKLVLKCNETKKNDAVAQYCKLHPSSTSGWVNIFTKSRLLDMSVYLKSTNTSTALFIITFPLVQLYLKSYIEVYCGGNTVGFVKQCTIIVCSK